MFQGANRWLCIILGVWCIRYGYLIGSGKLSLFVHPRLHIFTYIMLAIAAMLILYLLCYKKHTITYAYGGVVSLLLLMVVSVPAMGSTIDPQIVPIYTIEKPDNTQAETETVVVTTMEYDDEGYIVFTNNNYYATITELYADAPSYKGNKVRTPGVVFKAPNDGVDEFGVGLYYMTCCAADAQLVGMKYQTDKEIPDIGEWVEVVGVIDVDDEGNPFVSVTDISSISPMKDHYMYH